MKRKVSINTIIIVLISMLNLSMITSSNSNLIPRQKESVVETVEKGTPFIEVSGVIDTKAVTKAPIVEKKTTTIEKKTAPKKTTTTKKTTTKKTTTKKTTTTKKETTAKPTKTLAETLKEKSDKYGIEIGNITISNSNFSRDLVKDDTSYYYLDHNLDKKEDHLGVPFIDYRNNFNGRKTIIYAHSSKTKNAPFNYLQNYNGNKSFYEQHKYITVTYGGKTYKYQIFSVYISLANSEADEGLEYYRVMKYTDEEWDQKIKEYKSKSDYETGVSVSKNDKILILQTCSMDKRYNEKYYRYNQLIMAKLISVK